MALTINTEGNYLLKKHYFSSSKMSNKKINVALTRGTKVAVPQAHASE
jgi:hypothetical protein